MNSPAIPASQSLMIIVTVSLCTILLRVGPMLLFPGDKKTPKVFVYLSQVLPIAVIGMLIVYCFKDVQVFSYPYGIPEIAAGLLTALLFVWKKNTLLSIVAGTAVYMYLIQAVFI